MRRGQTWLGTATLLLILGHSEMKHSTHLEDIHLKGIRHHHRHKHKEEAQTLTHKDHLEHLLDRFNVPIDGYREKTLFDKNLVSYDMVALEDRHNDWFNISKDFGELKEKKHLHWPIKREAVIEGDLVLGGLMMVHERSDNMTCGPVMPQGGVQALETMLYTLDIINNELKLIPGVKIGAHILDDCDRDTYGLEMAVDFIKGKSYCILFCRTS